MTEYQRADLLERVWAKAEPMVFVEKDVFLKAYDDWNIYGVTEGDILVAVVGEKGPEFHFETMGTGKAFSRSTVTNVLQGLIDRHGYAVTKTPKDEERQHRFNRLIGFEVTGEDEYDVYYRIDRIRGRPVS